MNITNMTKLSEMGFDFIRSEIKMVIMTVWQLEMEKISGDVILQLNYCKCLRIPTVKLEIPGKSIGKVGYRSSIIFKL